MYHAEIVAGSLLIPESRKIAAQLLEYKGEDSLKEAILTDNLLQKRSPATAQRQARLIRKRLALVKPELWRLIVEGSAETTTQALMAAAIKHSRLLGDFMITVCGEHWVAFNRKLDKTSDWRVFLESCMQIEPEIDQWSESTVVKLRQVIFRILAEGGYLDNTRSLELQPVSVVPEIRSYLAKNSETYILRCMEITK